MCDSLEGYTGRCPCPSDGASNRHGFDDALDAGCFARGNWRDHTPWGHLPEDSP